MSAEGKLSSVDGRSPSPRTKKMASTTEAAPSPKTQESHMTTSREGLGSISSPTESSTPKSKKTIVFPSESPSPKKKDRTASTSTGAASSTSRPSSPEKEVEGKSSKRRKGKKGGSVRKERKRGLSTSSSEPRSRTESVGSEPLDLCEAVDASDGVVGVAGEADHTAGETASQHLTTPTETPSPSAKSRESGKKRRGEERSKKRRHGSKRERGLSSSSDDPKPSLSLGSEAPDSQAVKDHTTDTLDDAHGDGSCFVQIPTTPCVYSASEGGAGGREPPVEKCPHLSVTDYDFSEC
jgi:hypothetical protein